MRREGGRAVHVAEFHAVRSPWYLAKLTWYAMRGLSRVLGGQLRWWVPGSFEMLQHAATTHQLMEWERVHRQIRSTRLWRGIVVGAEAVVLGVGVPVLLAVTPTGWLVLAGAGVADALAHYGRPAGRSLIGTAVVAPRFRKLNSDIVLRAYYAAGLGHPSKSDMQVQFGSPMSRDARNTGSQVVIDLPYGKGWSDVMKEREKIASGLDVHVNQVFLTPDKTSSRRHTALLEDLDFEDLFDEEMDGIEDDPARQATMGIYVPGVADWFSPFNDDSVVHPYAETQPTARPAVHRPVPAHQRPRRPPGHL